MRVVANIQEQYLPIELEQLLLNIIRTAIPVCQEYDSLKPTLQEVRLAISGGDFERAFYRLDWLEAYTARWTPSRALCCATFLVDLCKEFQDEFWTNCFVGAQAKQSKSIEAVKGDAKDGHLKAVCFGGGATETIAFAGALRYFRAQSLIPRSIQTGPYPETLTGEATTSPFTPILNLHLIDMADWKPVVSTLMSGLITPPVLSKYASQTAKDKNAAFITADVLRTSFLKSDILKASQEDLISILGSQPSLITIFFTLNDMFAFSTAKTTAFLLKLTLAAPTDSLLLVVDSVKSMQATTEKDEVWKEKRKFGLHNLLDLVLMDKHVSRPVNMTSAWEELVRDPIRLFKLAEGLQFPIGLENMRFQVHLFKKR